MIEFRTFGTIDLRAASDGRRLAALLAQPKRIALLTYLAVASPRGFHRRDTLIGIFWPEAAGDRARATLNQTVYLLRRVVGEDVIVARGDEELGVNAAAIRCDATTFQEAIGAGRLAEGLDLYAGDFLNGFHLSAAPEFERWTEETRAQLKRTAARSARDLAEREVDAGDPAGAAHWLRRAVAIEPYDEPTVRQLVGVLAALGDRPGALREFDAFVTRLSRDLEIDPSEEITSFVDALRANGITSSRVDRPRNWFVEPRAPDTRAAFDQPATRAAAPAEAPPPTKPNAPGTDPARSRRRLGTLWLGATVVALAAVMALFTAPGAGVRNAFGGGDRGRFLPNRVIVLPFENRTGDSAVTTLGRMAADWVTQRLQRTGLVEVIDPNTAFRLLADVDSLRDRDFSGSKLREVAVAARAGTVVWGWVSSRDGELEFQVRVTRAHDGTVLHTLDPVRGPAHDITGALDVLPERVAGALAAVVDARLATVMGPSSSPPTFQAYHEFVQGMDRFESAEYANALSHYNRAADLDSTFLQARFWAAYALVNGGQTAIRDSMILSLVRQRERLGAAEQAGLDMFVAWARGNWEAAVEAARRAARLAPQSRWMLEAANLSLKLGRPRDALAHLAELDPTRGWPKRLPGYWRVRVEAHHQLGEYAEALAAARLALRTLPEVRHRLHHVDELDALAMLGRMDELDRMLDSVVPMHLARGATQSAAGLYYSVGLELRGHGFGEHASRYFERCLEIAREYYHCVYELGRYAEAYALIRSRPDTLDNTELSIVAARLGRRDEAERFMAIVAARYSPLPDRQYWLRFQMARTAALLGQREKAINLLSREALRGTLWNQVHDATEFDSIRDDPTFASLLHPPHERPRGRSAVR